MLVLTRKIGEAIRIGADVTVRVLEVRGAQIRLGLTAPSGVRILREEVFVASNGENGAERAEKETPGVEACDAAAAPREVRHRPPADLAGRRLAGPFRVPLRSR